MVKRMQNSKKMRNIYLAAVFCLLFSCNGNLEAYNAGSKFSMVKYKKNRLSSEVDRLEYNNKKIRDIKSGITEYDYCNGGYYKVGDPYKINGKTFRPRVYAQYKEDGLASWYGENFHNKKTANGEKFNMNSLTAAHRTLPLPSIVKVTNLENGKSVIVRVNDRGPFADEKDRIIDLSRRASEELEIKNKGLAKVRVRLLPTETKKYMKKCAL
jgi:rare lipoprotein A